MPGGQTLGEYYALPVIASFEGIDKQVNAKLGKVFGDVGKSGGKQIAKGVGEGLKDLERQVDSAAKAYQKLKDRADDALGKVRVEEEKLAKARNSGKADRIVAAEERLAKARRDSARATRDAGDGHSVLLSAQKKLGDASGDLGGKLGLLSGVAGRLGPVIAGAGAAAAGAAVGGIALLAAGAVRATSELYQLGSQFDDISDTLRIKTGATGATLDGLTESVKNIGKTVPVSLGDLGDIVAETNRNLHLTGPALDDVAGTLANLGRLTGEQVDIRGLGKAFRGFGVEAKDQVPALDGLFRASQKSGISVNDLIATVVKGGPALRQFGLGFGESAALAATFEDAGLDADKAMAGLTKGLATLAKDGKTGRDVLQDNVTQIKALVAAGDDPGALDLTNKLFGAKGGINFFDAIKNGSLDLDNLAASMDTTGDTIKSAAEGTADWSERWQLLKNEAADALQPLATGVFNFVNKELASLADWVSTHHNEIVDFFVKLGDAAITGAEFTIHALGDIAHGFGELIAPIGDVLGAVNKFEAWQADIRGDHETANELRAQAEEFFSMGEGLKRFGDNAKNFSLAGLRADFHDLGEQAKNATDNVAHIGSALSILPPSKAVVLNITDGKGNAISYQQFIGINSGSVTAPPGATTPGQNPLTAPLGRSKGGVLPGYSPGVDNMLVPMSGGEGVLIPQAVRALGPGFVYGINDMFKNGYAGGGIVGEQPDVAAALALAGTGYSQGNRTDCSGMIARVINRAMGLPDSGLMSTKTAAKWLADRGFRPGLGGPGQISVGWYDHGPGPNDGHMAMTLSDGTNAEAGGRNGVFTIGAGAMGADSPQFDQHMFLPTIFGEGAAGASSYSSGGGGTPGYGPNGEPGTYQPASAKELREANQKVADADTRVKEAEAKQRELEADAKESQKIAAAADVEKAKREAADARADLAEVKKGKFTAGSPSGSRGSRQGGLGQFGTLGDIAGSFLKETFGLDGSFFPDISNLMPVQMLGAALNAFAGPLQGAVDGKLGIQQPGWHPGMPVPGAQTSGDPFGMTSGTPDVATPSAPPMPPIGLHPGSGALPGPAGAVTIDASTNIAGNVGWSADEIERRRRGNEARAIPRIPAR